MAINPDDDADGLYDYLACNPSSNHPGGVNVAFGDGTVRFVKDTISTWKYDPTTFQALNTSYSGTNGYAMLPGCQPGVWQALSTRSGGEVISSDAY